MRLPEARVVAAAVVLALLVNLSYKAVLRVRETHADATAACLDFGAMRHTIEVALTQKPRPRKVPRWWATHPSLSDRLDDLDKPGRLAAVDGLALFSAGIATSLITVNLWFMAWVGVLAAWPAASEKVAWLGSGQDVTGANDLITAMHLLVFGPSTLLIAVVVARFGCMAMWRAQTGSIFGSGNVSAWRAALPLAAGLMLGEPASVLYANAGIWGVFDHTTAWAVADFVVSAILLAVITMVVFQLAKESAAVWIPVARAPLRRMGLLATVTLAAGAFPFLLTFVIAHNTLLMTELDYVAAPEEVTWPLATFSSAFAGFMPLEYLKLLPGIAVLFALPNLFIAFGMTRRPSSGGPSWLPQSFGAPADALRRAWPRISLGKVLKRGFAAAAVIVIVALATMTVFHNVIGGSDAVMAMKYYGGITLIVRWVMWISFGFAVLAALLAYRRAQFARLAIALLTIFIAATWAAPFLPPAVYVTFCGPNIFTTCLIGQPQPAITYVGLMGSWPLIEAALVTVFLVPLLAFTKARRNVLSEQDRSSSGVFWPLLLLTLTVFIAVTSAYLHYERIFAVN